MTALLATHVTDNAARQALAADLHDLFSHYKPKETQAQLDIKAQVRSFKATPRKTMQHPLTTDSRTRHDTIPVPFPAKADERQECVGQSDHSIQPQSHIADMDGNIRSHTSSIKSNGDLTWR